MRFGTGADPKALRIEIRMVIERVNVYSRIEPKRAIGNEWRGTDTSGSEPEPCSRRFAANVEMSERNACCELISSTDFTETPPAVT
jgi:hypothetical protein